MNRIENVVRMHLVNRWSFFVLPWIVLGAAFAVTLAVWFILRGSAAGAPDGILVSGAVGSVFAYELVLAVQSINLSFPFALGMSATRREFFLGTAVTFLIVAAVIAAGLTVLAALEDATAGWGVGGLVFTIVGTDGGPLGRWFGFLAMQLFFVAIGAVAAAVYMRWRTTGMVVLWLALSALFVVLFAFVTAIDGWASIGGWLIATGPDGLPALSLFVTAAIGWLAWLVLRRATPRG